MLPTEWKKSHQNHYQHHFPTKNKHLTIVFFSLFFDEFHRRGFQRIICTIFCKSNCSLDFDGNGFSSVDKYGRFIFVTAPYDICRPMREKQQLSVLPVEYRQTAKSQTRSEIFQFVLTYVIDRSYYK